MTSADRHNSTRAASWSVLYTIRHLPPPIRSGRFWLVQVGVLLIAFLRVVVLEALQVRLPFGIPASTTTMLLFVPVIYAARNFGVRGAIGTALWATTLWATMLWATVLTVPDWIFLEQGMTTRVWVEISNLTILNVLAVVVGTRVEREEQARGRVEQALRASEIAEARYRVLFEEQA